MRNSLTSRFKKTYKVKYYHDINIETKKWEVIELPSRSVINAFDFEDDSIFQHRTIEIEPITGRLIMFPSWLYHGTRQGEFDPPEKRVSLSFNVMPTAKIKDHTRKLNLL